MAEWTDLLVVHGERVRLGTLLRLGVSLGWDTDDLAVKGNDSWVYLLRRTSAVADRPPVIVLAGEQAIDEWADAGEVPEPDPLLPLPPEPPADGDAAPLDTPLAAFDEAMAAKAKPPTLPSGRDILAKSSSAKVTPADDATVAEVMAATDLPLTRYCRQCGREFVSKKAARFHEDNDHSSPAALTCDDCGWLFVSGRGFNHHAVMKHGAGYARPKDPPDDPGPSAPVGPPKVRCTDCDYSSLFADDLNNHCLSEHRRRATPLERTPR